MTDFPGYLMTLFNNMGYKASNGTTITNKSTEGKAKKKAVLSHV
jgi:hypothetical protein